MKKGFTLIELMGVLLILGIIASIVFVSVDSNIKNSRQRTCQTQERNIIEGAKMYFTDNPKDSNVTIEKLKEEGYIDDLKNPMTNKPYNNTMQVTKNDGSYIIEYNGEKGCD